MSNQWYKPKVTRNVTKKWAEARQVDYGGDEWGDDGYDPFEDEGPAPVSARNARPPGWARQDQPALQNPSPTRSAGRHSFDRQDDKRYFSTAAGSGFESAYPTTQRAPVPEPIHDESQFHGYHQQPSLQLDTNAPAGTAPTGFRPSSRNQQYLDHPNAPFSAPAYPNQHARSNSRPAQPEGYGQGTHRPESRGSNASGRAAFPPRKASLSYSQPPINILPQLNQDVPMTHTPPEEQEVKPLPFLRPADIYKRFEEEKEKERRSTDSARQSVDSGKGSQKERGLAHATSSTEPGLATTGRSLAADDQDSSRRQKPTLGTVAERKSEYGFDDMPKDGGRSQQPLRNTSTNTVETPSVRDEPSILPPTSQTASVGKSATSSNTSTSELGRNSEDVHPRQTANMSMGGLPPISRTSTFGSDLFSREAGEISAVTAASSARTNDTRDALHHQPSLGYRTMVNRAFENEGQEIVSPSTTKGHLSSSDSFGSPEISPIVSRTPEPNWNAKNSGGSEQRVLRGDGEGRSEHAIPATTVAPTTARPQTGPSLMKAPAPVLSARREESPAKRPLSLIAPDLPGPERGLVSAIGEAPSRHSDVAGDAATPAGQPSLSHAVAASPQGDSTLRKQGSQLSEGPSLLDQRSVSEEWKDWAAARRQFKSSHGMQDSEPTTPGVPSPELRTSSPGKMPFRDATGNTGPSDERTAAQGATSVDPKNPRPTPNPRLDTFRPSIPGGWQSYSTLSGAASPMPEKSRAMSPAMFPPSSRTESSESIPTATAPRNRPGTDHGPITQAFAAAAAAGSALAGAFSGHSLTDTNDDSSVGSERDLDHGPTGLHHDATSSTRDFAGQSPDDEYVGVAKPQTSFSTGKYHNPDTAVADDSTVTSPAFSTTDYFPAPLRTHKLNESRSAQNSPIGPHVPSHGSSSVDDPDQLQRDIVKSLTPRSSQSDDGSVTPEDRRSHPPTHTTRPRDTEMSFEDEVPSKEYSSYWSPTQTPSNTSTYDKAKGDDTGLRTSQPTSTAVFDKTVTPVGAVKPTPLQAARAPTTETNADSKPVLEQRFSWETTPEAPASVATKAKVVPPVPKVPDVVDNVPASTNEAGQTTVIDTRVPAVDRNVPDRGFVAARQSPEPQPLPAKAVDPSPISATRPVADAPEKDGLAFRDIMAMESSQAKLRAFEENRLIYAQPNPLLQQWLASEDMAEHANANSPQLNRPPTSLGASLPRPLHVREGSQNKLMPGDGSKLFAAAGRYSGRAGVAAKGLLAKGKDKLRTASASEKGFLTIRRRSTDAESDTPALQQQQQQPSLPSIAPQIPTPIATTPIVDDSWSFFDPKNDKSTVGPKSSTDLHSSRAGPPTASKQPPLSPISDNNMTHEGAENRLSGGISQASDLPNTRDVKSTLLPASAAESNLATSRALPGQVSSQHRGHQRLDSLSVPTQTRRSSVSDVSSIEPETRDSLVARTVSPEIGTSAQYQPIPPRIQTMTDKEAEAQGERMERALFEDPLPAYDGPSQARRSSQDVPVGPKPQIVPIARLDGGRDTDGGTMDSVASRPFSFAGSEHLSHSFPNQHDSNTSSFGQAFDKRDTAVKPGSYKSDDLGGRPYGNDPDVDRHPALRPDRREPVDESPLPSARRPPQETQHLRQTPVSLPREGSREQDYRIPGPYRQEFRAPKSKASQDQLQSSSTQPPVHQNSFGGEDPRVKNDAESVNRPVVGGPQAAGSGKDRSFGAMFRTRSKSRPGKPGEDDPVKQDHVARNRRSGLFRLGTRQSFSSGNSENNGYDQDADTRVDGPGKSRRRSSRDLLRSSTYGLPTPVEAGKKKRFSGITGFFKSENRDGFVPPSRSMTQPEPSRQAQVQVHPQSAGPFRGPTFGDEGPFRNIQPPAGSYHGSPATPPTKQSHIAQGGRGHAPFSPAGHQQVSGARPSLASGDERPSQLRIDTGPDDHHISSPPPGGSSVANGRSIDPPRAHTGRDAPHAQDRPSNPADVRSDLTGNGNTGISPRVKQLHTRSRSPRLGRQPSTDLDGPSDARGADPVSSLGMFNNKKVSPTGGEARPEEDQEKPWTIGLPGEDAESKRRDNRDVDAPITGPRPTDTGRAMIEQTTGRDTNTGVTPADSRGLRIATERSAGPSSSNPLSSQAQTTHGRSNGPAATQQPRAVNKPKSSQAMIFELSGSKPAGYESEDEPEMTATAYPGQEWQPVFERWDD